VLQAAGAGFGLFFVTSFAGRPVAIEAAAATRELVLAAGDVPQFVTPLLIPPVMPRAGTIAVHGGKNADYYEIAVRQVSQQILPAGMPPTTVWAYGPAGVLAQNGAQVFHAPSLTIETQCQRPVRVRWVNELVDGSGRFLPHLLPVDPTLHWANPPGGADGRDTRPTFVQTPGPYRGPVPLVTHVHGALPGDESDGYPEAWFLPDAVDIPADFAREGTWYDFFGAKARARSGVVWRPGSATFDYPNAQRASTLWYHDHTLGMTRLNVYAGPAGFFIVRGGPEGDEAVRDARTGRRAVLPGPAPRATDAVGHRSYYEIPLAIQDRTFQPDGSLFYPDSRAYFDGTVGPYIPAGDVPPIWNPEFFGSTIMVNGATWPFLTAERRRYRFRMLNGCDARFLILDFTGIPGAEVWQLGTETGFLAAPVDVMRVGHGRLLLAPAERADVVVDLTAVPEGSYVLRNVGPDEPFGGGEPDEDFDVADPDTTGRVLQLRVVAASTPDLSTPPRFLVLPPIAALVPETVRRLVLAEQMSMAPELGDDPPPVAAMLGTVGDDGTWAPHMWSEPVTETPAAGGTELWELYNTTADAHPIHVHATQLQVVDREPIVIDEEAGTVAPAGGARPPEPSEEGLKDTVIAYPAEVTRIRMRFGEPGQFVWHCHIVEHEDNEMMRPVRVGPHQPGQPADSDGGGM
jgi:FtsP/CotA-like multicopper oxidase with cupredoxin domain